MALRVLIVDDEPTVRANLAAYLEDEDMLVRAVSSGEEALELTRNGVVFDVCIMDMRLPGMNGNETILALHEEHPELRFLVHTGTAGYALPDDIKRCDVATQHVFRKPLSDMELLAQAVRARACEYREP